MPWQVKKNEGLGFIETVYTGVVTKKDSQDATAETLSLATGEGPHLFLSDLSEAQSKLSVMDIYVIPDEWEAAGASRDNRLALVVSERSAEPADVEFYENVTNNRGWNVRVFGDRQAAIDWLVRS